MWGHVKGMKEGTLEEPVNREWAWVIKDPKSRKGICQEVEDRPRAWGFLGGFPTPSLYSPCPNLPSFGGFLRGSIESLMWA